MWVHNDSQADTNNDTFSGEDEELVSLSLRNTILQVNGCVLLVLAFVGLPNNIINMMAFYNLGLNVGINTSLFVLSAANFGIACLFVVLAVITLDESTLIRLSVDLGDLKYAIRPAVVCISAFGSGVIALINIERFCYVALPVRFRDCFSGNRSRGLMAGMLVFQMMIFGANFDPVSYTLTDANLTGRPRLALSVSMTTMATVELLCWAENLPIMLSFTAIVLTNIYIVVALQQRSRWLRELSGLQNVIIAKNRKLIRIALAIATAHSVCYLPRIIYHFRVVMRPKLRPQMYDVDNFTYVSVSFMRIFLALPAAFNTVVFVMMNSGFNMYVKEVFSLPLTLIRKCTQNEVYPVPH